MLRLSKLTDYAVVVLVRLDSGSQVQTSPGIAATTGIPEPTVAKVLKTLSGAALVTSQRGARGGYRLARALDRFATITLPLMLPGILAGAITAFSASMRAWAPFREIRPLRGARCLAGLLRDLC